MARGGDSACADDANFTDFLEAQARARADELALRHPGGVLCYGELDERIWSAAAFLHERGTVAGDIVTPAFDDELSTLLVTVAAMRLGATIFSRPRGFAGAALARELSGVGVTSLVTVRSTTSGVREIVLDPMRRPASSRHCERSIRASNPTAPAVLVSGSGTTGRSKLIATGHRAYLHRLERTFVHAPTEPDDRVFSLVHSEYDAGRRTVLATLYHGGVAVFADRHGGTLAGICRKFAITVVWTTVSDLEIALDQLPSGTTTPALPGLRELYVGTSTVGVSLRERAMRRLTPHLYVRYGINECGPISIATPEQVASLPGTVGKPCPGVRIDIVDARGAPAGPVKWVKSGSADRGCSASTSEIRRRLPACCATAGSIRAISPAGPPTGSWSTAAASTT